MELDFLKDKLSPETFESFSKELSDYADSHNEKIRLVNVSTGDYVKSAKLVKANEEIERLKGELETVKGQIKSGDEDAEKKLKSLQDQIDAMTKQDAEREADRRLNERFFIAKGEKEFLNEFTETGVKKAFKAALSDPQNAGKSDADVYSAVVNELGEVYKNPNKPGDIHPMGNVEKIIDAERFKSMSLSEQMKFAYEHEKEYKKLMQKE